jgi:hypothetical protein
VSVATYDDQERALRAQSATLRDAPSWCRFFIFAGCTAYAVTLVIAAVRSSFWLFDACIQVPLWAAVTVPIARRIARAERDAGVFGFVMAAFSAKMLGVLVRQAVAFGVYNGVLDANTYDKAGKQFAPYYRHFDFSPETGKLVGTGFLKALTGIVYAFLGTSQLGAFVFFSFLSFLGLLMLWRAFRRAVPNGDGRRYGLLVLFLPSLLYWPSALGKEGWGLMCVGLCSYGVALMLTRKLVPGFLALVAGLVGVTMLRPHVALVVFGGLVFAALLGKPRKATAGTPLIRAVVFGALFVTGLILVSQAQSFLGVSSLDQTSVGKKLDKTQRQTGKEAGSTFTPARIHSPIDVPWATVTVLFRPLPWEAGSGQEMAATAESVFLIVLAYKSRRRLRSIVREARSYPYVAYCIGFTAMFIFAFSSFANFGLLARQRTQTIPLVLTFLCLPEFVPKWKQGWTSSDAPGEMPRAVDVTGDPTSAPVLDGPYARFAGASPADPVAHATGYTEHGDPYAAVPDPYARFRDVQTPDDPYGRFRTPESRGDVDERFPATDRAGDSTADATSSDDGTPSDDAARPG